MLEILLINHPLDCPSATKVANALCSIRRSCWGPGTVISWKPSVPNDVLLPSVQFTDLDRERCIPPSHTRFSGRGFSRQINLLPRERGCPIIANVRRSPAGRWLFFSLATLSQPGWHSPQLITDLSFSAGGSPTAAVRPVAVTQRFAKLFASSRENNLAVDDGWLCDRGRFSYKQRVVLSCRVT